MPVDNGHDDAAAEHAADAAEHVVPGSRRDRGVIVDVALVVLLSVLLAIVGLVAVMRIGALSPSTYQAALVEVDAYERAYTEVLADPELAAIADPLVGSVVHPRIEPAEIRALTTNLLRWTLPPATLQATTERVLDLVLGYVRGDIDDLAVEVDVTAVVDRIPDVTITGVRTSIARLPQQVVDSDQFTDALLDFRADVEAGRIPDAIPTIGGRDADPVALADTVVDLLGVDLDPALERRIRAAAEIDERSALIEASSSWVRAHAGRAAERAAERAVDAGPDAARRIDLRAAATDRAARSTAAAVEVLDRARDAASILRPSTAWAAALLAAIVALALMFRGADDRARAGTFVSIGFVAGGVLTMLGWFAITRFVGTPVAAAVDAPGEQPLPSELTRLLLDLERAVASDLWWLAIRFGGYLLVAGVVILGAARGVPGIPSIPPRAVPVAIGAVVAVVVATGAMVLLTADGDSPRHCNGHVELCNRAYDGVVQAATHNSMSSPDVVPVWPEHDGDIRSQLDAGVRVLLIDTHYWTPIRSVQALLDVRPDLTTSTAERLLDTLGDRTEGRPGTFLCHNHCVFGAMPFGDALDTVREFLDEHPHDIVTLVIQDAITPADTEAAFEEAGLLSYLYVHDESGWPTLGTMIDRGDRLVVLAEEAGPPPDWYHQGFELMQETPFFFRSADNMSCRPNRGDPDATLFQMNHWIQRIAPDRVDSVVINDHDFLVDRALRCRDERGLLPNFLAVNFYSIGDLMEAVDTLNGLSSKEIARGDRGAGS